MKIVPLDKINLGKPYLLFFSYNWVEGVNNGETIKVKHIDFSDDYLADTIMTTITSEPILINFKVREYSICWGLRVAI